MEILGKTRPGQDPGVQNGNSGSNIAGIKEEAGIQPTQATAFALRTSEDFSIYCGDDTMVLQVLPQRGVGVVSGGSQVIGDWMKGQIEAYYAGDNVKASRIYFRMAPFFASLNQNGRINPIPILRGAIERVSGIKIGSPRSPQVPATAAELAVTNAILDGLARDRELLGQPINVNVSQHVAHPGGE